jgi:enoyl-CoA hydratase/carnithine racemase
VTFDNPPINLIDPVMAVELDALLTEIEQDDRLAVVVFDSADREYFLAHFRHHGRSRSVRRVAGGAHPVPPLGERADQAQQVAGGDDQRSAG